jgi:hypothetical protein
MIRRDHKVAEFTTTYAISVYHHVIKSLVTNFNHYISRAWDQGPTMQPEYQEKTTDLSEYSQYTDKLYHIQLYRADPYELDSNAQH